VVGLEVDWTLRVRDETAHARGVMSTGATERLRLGFLYPGYAAEDDYPLMATMVGQAVVADLVHTSVGKDAHEIDALLDLGAPERLLDGAALLRTRNVRSIVWACTSGSFVFGLEGARRQVAEVEAATEIPTSSTSLAFVDAVRALGLRRVTIAATYPLDVSDCFMRFLVASQIDVIGMRTQGILTAVEVGTFDQERIRTMVRENDHPDAEAILVPDTALHSAAWVEDLEAMVNKPVLTANQVSFWKALRLAGSNESATGLGTLLRAA
jgi:maleate cis-trans isomerase